MGSQGGVWGWTWTGPPPRRQDAIERTKGVLQLNVTLKARQAGRSEEVRISSVQMKSRTLLLITTTMLAGGFAACDDDAPELTATDSGVEGVPIPESAEPHPEVDTFWNVEGVRYDDLVAWYEDQMPEGEDFDGWEWCDTGGGETIHAHIYARGEQEILAVTVSADDRPSVSIGTDESGPC